jgi:ADP-ribose pyrophosphatase YjhB (NUDIX family)
MTVRTKKHSVAFVIYNAERTKVIIVRRPKDDEDLPNVWGLPAGSLKNNETFEDTVARAAMDKLGVKVDIMKLVNEGEIGRDGYVLHMKEYEASITEGSPKVPQPIVGITQYAEWRWGTADDLVEAAQKGSLCSRLFLQSIHQSW